MSEITGPMLGLTIGGVARYASCWQITRTDGVVHRFTDHNRALVYEGNTYTPVGGVSASARERDEGLSPQNLEVKGPLVVDSITENDLWAGRFRRAVVRETVIDWKYPTAGKYREDVYVIREPRFTGETWEAQMEGILSLLQVRVGNNYERKCRWKELGNANCGFNLASVTQTGREVAVVSDAAVFTSDIATGNGDGYFDDGEVEFTTGDNAGVILDVKAYVESGGEVTLQVAPPFTIAPGDQFTIRPGCDRRASTCKTKFDNFNRFGGFPFIPGNRKYLSTPDAKQQ